MNGKSFETAFVKVNHIKMGGRSRRVSSGVVRAGLDPTVPPYSLELETKVLEHNTHIFAPPAAGRPHPSLKYPDT